MYRILFVLLLSISILGAQSNNSVATISENDSTAVDKNQRAITFSFGLLNPGLSESGAIGKATDDRLSFNLGLQVFVYKHFYIAGFTGTSYLEVNDKSLIGNYNRSTITQSYLQFGYEFPINNGFRLGINYTPLGEARYKNVINGLNNTKQIDIAKITMYGVSLSYNVSNSVTFYIDYNYRNDKTKIKAASQIQDDFSNIQYHTIGIGIRFYGGTNDLVTRVKNYF